MQMRNSDLPIVRALPLFTSMSELHFDALVHAAYLQSFPAHVDLIVEGDRADFLHVLLDGRVELFARSNGRESSIRLVGPVSTFILAAVVTDSAYLMSARTFSRAQVLMLPAVDVRTAFENDAVFARAIVNEMAVSYRSMVRSLKNVKLRTGVERLSNCLLDHHKDQGASGVLQLPCDKRTLASLLGMTAENLSRAFNTLKPYGVEVAGSEIYLSDIDALTVLAKPNPLIEDWTAASVSD